MTISKSETSTSSVALENTNQSAFDLNVLKNALSIFLIALLVRLWFNFGTEHVNAFNNADASEYLRYATALSKLNWLHPVYGPEWKEFVISGPAFPFALWLFNFLSFQPYSADNFITPLIFQSIVSAAICSFSYLTALRLFGKNPATFTALASIIYPAFIVNSGRLYSEVFATFLLSVALWLYAIAQRQPVNQKLKQAPPWLIYFALGITVTLLQLTRSAMLLFSVFTAGFVLLAPLFEGNNIALESGAAKSKAEQFKTGAKHLAAFILGFALVTAPWLVFEKSAFNRTNLVVDRTGNYNLFIGTATKIQGFLSYPYPDGAGIQAKSYGTLIKAAYKERPGAFIKLMLDKPARLFKFPWNDYRTPIGPIGFNLQVLLHEFLILMAVVGLCLGFATSNGFLASNLVAGRLYLVFAFLLNLPYLAFITVPRYNLMAMPVLIIFAGVGFCTLLKLVEQAPKTNTNDKTAATSNIQQLADTDTSHSGEESEAAELSLREKIDLILPQLATMSTVFLFVYLRDDLRPDAIFAGSTPLSIYLVQASPISRGIISGIAGVLLFASLYLCIDKLSSLRDGRLARLITVLCAAGLLPLLFLPQRSNGRFGEAILTVSTAASGKSQMLKGSIPLDEEKIGPQDQLYLLIDSDKAQILDRQIKVKAADTELTAAPIPGLAALDDWNYLKVRPNGTAYLDGTYIFDCMTQTGDMTNLDVRQWYLLPLPPSVVQKINSDKRLDLTLAIDPPDRDQNHSVTFFGKDKGKQGPALALYSWEKAFYGVENDHGLTDSRMDERYKRSQPISWEAVVDGKSEKLQDIDLNMHLLKVTASAKQELSELQSLTTTPPVSVNSQQQQPPKADSISGKSTVSLPITKEMLKSSMQLAELHIDYPPGYDKNAHFVAGLSTIKPQFDLSWVDDSGLKCTMLLPWTKIPQEHFAIAIPLKLQNIKGQDIKLNCSYIDDHCTITLKLKDLVEHPLFGPHKIY